MSDNKTSVEELSWRFFAEEEPPTGPSHVISVRLPVAAHEVLQRLARRGGTSTSNSARLLLVAAIRDVLTVMDRNGTDPREHLELAEDFDFGDLR